MALITAESAKGKEADLNKLQILLYKGEDLLDRGERGDVELLDARFQLAKALVAVAEMSLERAYRKALPVYEEAIKSGTGDKEALATKRDTMQSALESAPY
jgi:hypothetical protein